MKSNWQKFLLILIVAVNLIIYGAIYMMSKQGKGSPDTPELEVGEPLELQVAYGQAQELALHWQSDAQLVSVTSAWMLATGDRLTLFRPSWSFHFYSPAARRVQIVDVGQEGARTGRQQVVDTAPYPVEMGEGWDSDDLLLTFMAYEGEAFMGAYPDANIHLWLKSEEPGRSIWYITAIDPVGHQSLTVRVDARSRQVISSEAIEGGG